jgi:hypothetical protein|nr:MAG TPA: ASCH domain protein [Bacteriophage sp.]
MAIKPILFNTEMVRAILEGRKSCTRRINKDANEYTVPDMDFYNADRRTYAVHNYSDKEHKNKLSIAERTCPICPGDVLYIRETWTEECGKYYYRADYDSDYLDPCETLSGGYPASCRNHPGCDGCMATSTRIHWHPSIHMPKEAARIWLKVTDVRVERLQDMTDDDAEAEGCFDYTSTALGFPDVWDSTIKKSDLDSYGWDANPWVWVIEFERCEKPEGV